MTITLTDFARARLFPREPRRNTIQDCTAEEFERHLNEVPPLAVLDGYAPFCKLHVHRNWTSTRVLAVPDRPTATGTCCAATTRRARARNCRCWCAGSKASSRRWPTTWSSSSTAVGNWRRRARASTPTGAWWAACTRADPVETPMAPITMMRNALGVEEGGSGVPLDREAYLRSVAFWSTHANWRGDASPRVAARVVGTGRPSSS